MGNPRWSIPVLPGRNGLCGKPTKVGRSRGRLSEEKPEPRFLAVDAKGKVTLVSELGDGAYWKLTRKGKGHSFDATIQASGGKLDGWYLGFSDEQEQIERGTTKYKSYRPELSEKPGPRTNLYIFIDGP